MDLEQFIYVCFSNRQVTSSERKVLIGQLLWATQEIEGDVVELGCFRGLTSVFISNILKNTKGSRRLFVYDTFEGLQNVSSEDENLIEPPESESMPYEPFRNGELDISLEEFERTFRDFNTELPEIHKGNVLELGSEKIPNKISFAYLDMDIYLPTKHGLELIWDKVSPNGFIMVDDFYFWKAPGAKKATLEFLDKVGIEYDDQEAHSPLFGFGYDLENTHDNEYPLRKFYRAGFALAIRKQ